MKLRQVAGRILTGEDAQRCGMFTVEQVVKQYLTDGWPQVSTRHEDEPLLLTHTTSTSPLPLSVDYLSTRSMK